MASNKLTVKLKLISESGPSLCNHVAVIIGNRIYVHGGVSKKRSNSPSRKLYHFSLDTHSWEEIDKPNGPALSHHAGVVIDQYMVLIGGWDGHSRISNVFVFDIEKQQWINPKVTGFPSGAGLSSHTATVLKNGDILVVGREGSLHTQRRSGNAFLLSGNIEKGCFKYTDYPMGVASRSGHTVNIVGSQMITIGGRSDKVVEQHLNYHAANTLMPSILKYLCDNIKSQTPMPKPPCGRKHHISATGPDAIFIHGGETFDGRSREPVGEMYLVRTKPYLTWYMLGKSVVGREGHICCWNTDQIIIHGGAGPKNIVSNEMYQVLLES